MKNLFLVLSNARLNSRWMVLCGFCTSMAIFSGCDSPEELGGCRFNTDLENLQLVWSDEFDSATIDDSMWSFDIGDGCDRGICGWGNNELQYYTDSEENAFIDDGILTIVAKREFPPIDGQYAYSSARMVTKNKGDWKYGRIDVRAKTPKGQGLWPAIWMLPTESVYGQWPRSGEIDIMELIGSEPARMFGTIHFGQSAPSTYLQNASELDEGTFNDEFHVFSVIWNESCINFLLDGEEYGEAFSRSALLPDNWPFDQDFHLLLNIAVGGNLPGNPDGSTVFPQTLEVDYVRVYQ